MVAAGMPVNLHVAALALSTQEAEAHRGLQGSVFGVLSNEAVGGAVYVEGVYYEQRLSDDLLLFADRATADNIDGKCPNTIEPPTF